MAKEKTVYRCNNCGEVSSKWQGKCSSCNTWNSLEEEREQPKSSGSNRYSGYAARSELTPLKEVKKDEYKRVGSGSDELDRVLGGGLVPGSVLLIGGDPGIGKSTLLLQVVTHLAIKEQVIYTSGEESKEQIAMRAERLNKVVDGVLLLAESNLEIVMGTIEATPQAKYAVIDSIQTMFSDSLQSAPGSVTQIRECAAQLTRLAKTKGVTMFFVGHVTKDGQLAGPRVLEHIVDTVLYFEGDENSNFRLLRAQKNRFGGANEVGVFSMTEDGLKDIKDPSAIFLGQDRTPVPGSCITVAQEGTRGILVEIQALAESTKQPNPRRLGVGIDAQRLSMILAVLNKACGIQMYDMDVFVTAVGGLKLLETGIDLSMALALVSSVKGRPLPEGFIALGEIDLTGKIRPIHHVQERLREAEKLGFKYAIIPEGNKPSKEMKIKCLPVRTLSQALEKLSTLS